MITEWLDNRSKEEGYINFSDVIRSNEKERAIAIIEGWIFEYNSMEEEIRTIVQKWVSGLKSGTGDWKKVYTEDYMDLLNKLGVATEADELLIEDMQGL